MPRIPKFVPYRQALENDRSSWHRPRTPFYAGGPIGYAVSTAGRATHPPPHNKGALFCFESLMLALSKTAIPIPRRLHSLPSFALFRLLGALSLCFYSVGRLCDSGKGTKNLAWNWGFLSGTIWFLALAC